MLASPHFLRERPGVRQGSVVDSVSEVFDLIDLRGLVTGGFAERGRWVSRGVVEEPFKLLALLSGRATVRVDGPGGPQGTVVLEPGDVVLLNHRTWLELSGGEGGGLPRLIDPAAGFPTDDLAQTDRLLDDVVIGGRIDVAPGGRELLARGLPGLTRVRAGAEGAAGLREVLNRVLDEVSSPRPGSAWAVRQHGQLLLLEVVRASLAQAADLPPGWFRAVADEHVGPALALLHGEPGRTWTVAQLAAACAMSRTSFASHFRAVAGVPPLTYLTQWRMLLARRALQDQDTSIEALAGQLGYSSASALSTAFTRHVGQPPLRYRRSSRPNPQPTD